MNPGSAPSKVLLRHLPDKTPDLGTCRRAAGHGPPAPEKAERAAVPGDHGVRLDENQGVLPAAPVTEDEGPESAVPARERQSIGTRSFQHTELVTESENLGGEGGPRGNEGNQRTENESDHRGHADKIPGRSASREAPAQIDGTLSY